MAGSRIYIGNLSLDVNEKHLKEEFSQFGDVSTIEIKSKLNFEGNPISRFAYLNLLAGAHQINECVQHLDGKTLKGSKLKVEVARESFLEKLKREREKNNEGFIKPKPNRYEKDYEGKEKYFKINSESFKPQKYEKFYSHQASNSGDYRPSRGFDSDVYHSSYNDQHDCKDEYQTQYEDHNRNYKTTSRSGYSNTDADEYEEQYTRNHYVSQNTSNFGEEQNNQHYIVSEGLGKNAQRNSEDSCRTKYVSSFKRYDPTKDTTKKKANRKQQKRLEGAQDEKNIKKYVEISSELVFQNNSSVFTLSDKFSKEIEQRSNHGTEQVTPYEEEETLETEKRLPLFLLPKRKLKNFFIKANDPTLKDAVEWILTPLTSKNEAEFQAARPNLISLYKMRSIRAVKKSRTWDRQQRHMPWNYWKRQKTRR